MKTFKDLEFKDRGINTQALIFFDNGYGASVITNGIGIYADKDFPYELAVVKGDKDQWQLCFDTSITDDVLGYLSENDVTRYLLKIQQLGIEAEFNFDEDMEVPF